MKTLKFYGASDDTAICEWKGGDVDHDDCANGSLRGFLVTDGDDKLVVYLQYAAYGGCWMVGIAQHDEEDRWAPWPMRWGAERYTTTLELDVPDSATVTLVLQ
jgi:hypothetical protein